MKKYFGISVVSVLSLVMPTALVLAADPPVSAADSKMVFNACHWNMESEDCGSDPELGGTATVHRLVIDGKASSKYRLVSCTSDQAEQVREEMGKVFGTRRSSTTINLDDCQIMTRVGDSAGVAIASIEERLVSNSPADIRPSMLAIFHVQKKGAIQSPALIDFRGYNGSTDGHSNHYLETVCDANGDGIPDIVIRKDQYHGYQDLLLKLDNDLKTIQPAESYDATGCTC